MPGPLLGLFAFGFLLIFGGCYAIWETCNLEVRPGAKAAYLSCSLIMVASGIVSVTFGFWRVSQF